MNQPLDPRLHAFRPDLAAAELEGKVAASRFAEGALHHVVAPLAPMRRHPAADAPLDTEALMGEEARIFDAEEGWAWGQLARDGYVGYLPMEALDAGPARATHRVGALRTFLYPGPSIKLPPVAALSYGAFLRVEAERDGFAAMRGGFVHAGHLTSIDGRAMDFVAEAERFLGAPYLWGGRSSLGLDCSALVSLALAAAGVAAPRDSDMQEAALGAAHPAGTDRAGLERGDLVFWRGHVGIMQDATRLLHANGFFMEVTSEPLAAAQARILDRGGGPVTSVRRLALP
jgi:cell wall-associated NlpC family hydrolase